METSLFLEKEKKKSTERTIETAAYLALSLIAPSRLEVRQEAQLALTTLLHFHFLSVDRSLLASLFGLARLGESNAPAAR